MAKKKAAPLPMLDRVAAAMCFAEFCDPEAAGHTAESYWRIIAESTRQYFRKLARAGLAALDLQPL